jgi:hypothetical protein
MTKAELQALWATFKTKRQAVQAIEAQVTTLEAQKITALEERRIAKQNFDTALDTFVEEIT